MRACSAIRAYYHLALFAGGHPAVKPVDELFGVLTEMVVGVEALVRLFDPKQFLSLRRERVENLLPVFFSLDEEVAP
jgi:hypothetical protein